MALTVNKELYKLKLLFFKKYNYLINVYFKILFIFPWIKK